MSEFDYMKERVDNQIEYFDTNALRNQRKYRFLKSTSVVCNILTTLTIAFAFTVPDQWRISLGILSLILSTTVLATYQWEEFQNYGAKWEKFRLVAEQLKSEKSFFLTQSGKYSYHDDRNLKEFVQTIEGIIRGTDVSYFALLVDPGKRIEKRLSSS